MGGRGRVRWGWAKVYIELMEVGKRFLWVGGGGWIYILM